jgi:hypothetical protein
MTGYEIACKIRPKRTCRQARQNSVTTHKKVGANSFIGELLALLLALVIPQNRLESSINGVVFENQIKREMCLDFVIIPPLDN